MGTAQEVTSQLNQLRWASARLLFIVYIGFSVITLVGGFLSAPLMTWYFFGDWRFWRHGSSGPGLLLHALRLLKLMLSHNRGFMFSVPLTSPPRSSPDLTASTLHPLWPHGSSCGDCSSCCRAGGYVCPLLDETLLLCRGYDSFYWRYFNCGRFPSVTNEIEYYGCQKWVLAPTGVFVDHPEVVIQMGQFDSRPVHKGSSINKNAIKGVNHRHTGAPIQVDAETKLDGQAAPPKVRESAKAWSPDRDDQRNSA
jgi:hypothetical protein